MNKVVSLIKGASFRLLKLKNPGTRTKKLLIGSASLAGSSGLSSLARVVTVVLLTRLYTKEQFGVWVTLNSVTAILVTSDLGLSSTLRNKLSMIAAKGKASDGEARDLFMGTFYVFGCFCMIICLLLTLGGHLIPYHLLFKGSNLYSVSENIWIFILIQVFLIMSMPFGLGAGAFFSYQEAHIYAVFTTVYSISGAIALCVLAWLKISVEATVASYFFLSFVLYALGMVIFLARRGWHPFPVNIRNAFSLVIRMLPLGSRFFVGQISWSFLLNVPTIVASTTLGVVDAALYGLIQKLFGFILQLYQSVTNPLWAGYADASSRNDWVWCRSILLRSLIVTISFFCAATLLMIFAGNSLLSIIGGGKYHTTPWLFLSFGVLSILTAVVSVAASLQNALGKINLIIVTTVFLSLTASSFLSWLGKSWGLQGIAFGAAILMMIVTVVVLWQDKYILNIKPNNPHSP